MKKKLAALAALSAIGATASAQSSVNVSGIVDAAARRVDNEGRGNITSLVSGSNATSRLIVSASEDLGAGRRLGFWLEHGLAVDTGAATGAFWDRRSTLSLTDERLGELRLGRDYVATWNDWVRFDNFGYLGAGGSNNLISATPLGPIRATWGTAANTTVRASNAIKYYLPPNLGGVDGYLMLSFAEGSGVDNTKAVGGRLGWSNASTAVTVSHVSSEVSTAVGGRFKDTLVGGSQVIGPARLSLAWRRFEQSTARQDNLLVGASASFGAVEVKGTYHRVDLQGRVGAVRIDANDAQQLALGVVYSLSKRSALYGTASLIRNEAAATFVVPGGPAGLAGGRDSRGIEFGIRHRF